MSGQPPARRATTTAIPSIPRIRHRRPPGPASPKGSSNSTPCSAAGSGSPPATSSRAMHRSWWRRAARARFRPCSPTSTASASARTTWPAWSSPTSTSTMPGGVGDVARAFPKATVYVHPKGARHLADPTKLVDSAARVYGPLLDSLYGRLDPTPAERIHILEDGEEIRVSANRFLTAVDSPGHAKHHLALHDNWSGTLFAGDAVGVKLPDAGVLRPSTPPPDFDLDQALHSLRRFAERRPTGLALAHYGLLADPLDVLDEADGTLRRWADVAEAGVPRRTGHRRRPHDGVRLRPRRGARGAPREARGDERGALERSRAPTVAGRPGRLRSGPDPSGLTRANATVDEMGWPRPHHGRGRTRGGTGRRPGGVRGS